MALPNAYDMETTDDMYVKIKSLDIEAPVSSRHAIQANENGIYFEAQDVPADERKYENIIHDEGVPRNRASTSINIATESTNGKKGVPRNRASTSINIATESTDGKKDKKCNLTNSAFMLAFLSLLVAIVAVSLVYVFSIKPNNDLQNQVVTSQSQKNLVAIMDQKTNILNATLSTVQQSTVHIQREQQTTNRSLQATNGQLQKLQSLINVLIFNHSDTEWLTLSNGFQYRWTNEKTNRNDARNQCNRLGGDLASVRMSEASIRTFLFSHFLTNSNSYWIGLKDRGDDDWYWINDNQRINNNSDIWFEGEPNNSGQGEDCAVLGVKMSVVKANDVNCGWPFYGLCEKSVAP